MQDMKKNHLLKVTPIADLNIVVFSLSTNSVFLCIYYLFIIRSPLLLNYISYKLYLSTKPIITNRIRQSRVLQIISLCVTLM